MAEGNQFKVIELGVCVCECAVLERCSLVFFVLCELRAKAVAGAFLRALCVCVPVLLWQQTVLLFPSGQVARQ